MNSTDSTREFPNALPARHALLSLPLLGLGMLLPQIVLAEGAIRLLDCSVIQACDAEGTCEKGSEQVSFRMEPISLSGDGSGQYEIRYDDDQAEMRALSDAGPFFWTDGQERHTLILSSETRFLWHRLTVEPAPEASVKFLSCSLQLVGDV